jgi:hypothetical protein
LKKITFYLIYILFIILLFELVFRAYYAISFKKPRVLYRPFAVIEHYYPGLLDVMDAEIRNDDEQLDILLLGGSVLTSMWGNVPADLESQLKKATNRPFKIYNLATPAHTSRDSRVKFDLLKNQKFDVVLVYHGINAVRFNHCPPDVFKADYSHVDFYAKTNALAKRTWSRFSVLPLVFIQLKTNILRTYAEDNYLPFHAPVKDSHLDWIEYGMEVKTTEALRANYTHIINESEKRGNTLVMPQFGFYIPEGYSLKKFTDQQLDYGRHRNPVELWGTVKTVTAGINAHNREIYKLQKEHNLPLLNMNEKVTKDAAHYDDLCHLAPLGSIQFVEAVLPFLLIDNTGG